MTDSLECYFKHLRRVMLLPDATETRQKPKPKVAKAWRVERELIRRLRHGAWMSAKELEERADLPKGSVCNFETYSKRLSVDERRSMVAMLEVLLTCRRGYVESVKRWRAETGISARQAGYLIGCSKFILLKIERGDFLKWPSQSVRDSIDNVLTEWERSKEPRQLAKAS